MGARRYDAKRDENEKAIVKALEAQWPNQISVQRAVPPVPDLLVGIGRVNVILEVKMPGEPLTPAQEVWHSQWHGQVCVVESPEQAIGVVARIAGALCPF